jgi:hypothetical protein
MNFKADSEKLYVNLHVNSAKTSLSIIKISTKNSSYEYLI